MARLAFLLLGGVIAVGAVYGPGPQADDPPARPAPAKMPPAVPRRVTYSADPYGQFWINGAANGVVVRFLADTGASSVTFGKRDAQRLGFDIGRLTFDGWASTANGTVRTASARIARLDVGPFVLRDVPISINDGDLGFPLLGMAFLRRMHVVMSNGTLTLSGEPR